MQCWDVSDSSIKVFLQIHVGERTSGRSCRTQISDRVFSRVRPSYIESFIFTSSKTQGNLSDLGSGGAMAEIVPTFRSSFPLLLKGPALPSPLVLMTIYVLRNLASRNARIFSALQELRGKVKDSWNTATAATVWLQLAQPLGLVCVRTGINGAWEEKEKEQKNIYACRKQFCLSVVHFPE